MLAIRTKRHNYGRVAIYVSTTEDTFPIIVAEIIKMMVSDLFLIPNEVDRRLDLMVKGKWTISFLP